jgi:GNAT superfamily N-acetyltransferase
MSVERHGHLELTHFFVEPGGQNKGIGSRPIERAFPVGRFTHRSINATLDARAHYARTICDHGSTRFG